MSKYSAEASVTSSIVKKKAVNIFLRAPNLRTSTDQSECIHIYSLTPLKMCVYFMTTRRRHHAKLFVITRISKTMNVLLYSRHLFKLAAQRFTNLRNGCQSKRWNGGALSLGQQYNHLKRLQSTPSPLYCNN